MILDDGTQATLTSLNWKHEPTIVLKIQFKPDIPVVTFMPSILSKGFRQKPFRRSKKHAEIPSPSVDAETPVADAEIPGTEGHLTD